MPTMMIRINMIPQIYHTVVYTAKIPNPYQQKGMVSDPTHTIPGYGVVSLGMEYPMGYTISFRPVGRPKPLASTTRIQKKHDSGSTDLRNLPQHELLIPGKHELLSSNLSIEASLG